MAIQLVLQQCCKPICTFFVVRFTVALLAKKKTEHVLQTLLYISLPLFCTTSTWIFLMQVLWRKCRMSSCSPSFFQCRSFSNRWPLAFLIFSPLVQKFSCFSSNEIYLLYYLTPLSLSLSLVSTSVKALKFSREIDSALKAVNSSSIWMAYATDRLLSFIMSTGSCHALAKCWQ